MLRGMPNAIRGESLLRRSHADGDETAKEAFAEAVEWQGDERFTGVTISDGSKSFTIAEFASEMALTEIANTIEAAEVGLRGKT